MGFEAANQTEARAGMCIRNRSHVGEPSSSKYLENKLVADN